MVIDAKRSVEREMLSVDRRKALVVELPLDVDLTLGKIGDGLERRNRQVQRLSVPGTRRTRIIHLSDNRLAIGLIDDRHPSAAVRVTLGVVGIPIRASVQSNDSVRVRLVRSTGTGVTVLVEVGG